MIEDVRSTVIRLADMTDEDAIDEGEGYADAAAFRVLARGPTGTRSSTRFATGIGDPTFTITDDTPIVVERFRIAAVLGDDGSPIEPRVRPAYPPDRPAVDAFLAEHNADVVARRGELVDARPSSGADRRGRRRHRGRADLDAGRRIDGGPDASCRSPVGGRRVRVDRRGRSRVAEASGARRLWLITTNDNVDALRFYQRRGLPAHAGRRGRRRPLARDDQAGHPRDRRARDPAPRRARAGDRLGEPPRPRRASRRGRAARPGARPRPPRRGRDPRRLRGRAGVRLPRDRRERTPLDARRDPRGAPRGATQRSDRDRVVRAAPSSRRACCWRRSTWSPPAPDGVTIRSRRSSTWVRHDDRWRCASTRGRPSRPIPDEAPRADRPVSEKPIAASPP